MPSTSLPADPSWRRLDTARLVLLVCLAVSAVFFVDALNIAIGSPERTDYVAFAGGARVLDGGSTCPYCADELRPAEVALLGHAPVDQTGFPIPYRNPPLGAWLLRPLGKMSLEKGLGLFLEISVLCLGLATLMLRRRLGGRHAKRWVDVALVAGVFSLPGLTSFRLAQWDPLLLLCAAGAFTVACSGRSFLAGVLLSLLLLKPQLVWLCVPVLLVAGQRRMLAGFLSGAASWLLTGLLIIGPGQFGHWVAIMRAAGGSPYTEGLPAIAATLWGDHGSDALTALTALAATLIAWRMRAGLRTHGGAAVGIALGLSVALSPHTFPHDLLLLAVPLAIWIARAPRAAVAAGVALSGAWLFDVYVSTAPLVLRHTEAVAAAVIAVGAALLAGSPEAARSGITERTEGDPAREPSRRGLPSPVEG